MNVPFLASLLAFSCLHRLLVQEVTAFAPSTTSTSKSCYRSSLKATTDENQVIDLLDSNYKRLFCAEKPLLIDAYATFCGPCKLIEPVVHDCAVNWADKLHVARWDVEALQTELKIELLLQGANPTKLPSLILVHQGKAVKLHSGLITNDQLDELLTEHWPVEMAPQVSEVEEMADVLDSERLSGFISLAGGMNQADEYMLASTER